MTMIASDWLGLAVLLSIFAWFAGRRRAAILLPFAVAVAAIAVWVPTGSPRFTEPPPGKYTVLGAKIEVDVAIWALLDDGNGIPRYFRLPYSSGAAGELQEAMDGAEDGQGVQAMVKGGTGGDGVHYEGPPPSVHEPEPKQAEQPAIAIP